MEKEDNAPEKKPYRKPSLTVYGDIRELTHANATTNVNDDGGWAGANKTGTP